jgi:6-phosphofructokinase
VLGRVCAHMEQVGGHCLVVVAEGARLPHGTARGTAGVAHTIGEELQKLSGIDCRVTVLGHVQRGGSPTHTDRILGTKFGVVAADLVDRRDYGSLVVLRNTRVESVRLSSEVGIQRLIDVATDETVAAARATGVCFGDSGCNPKDL